MVLQLQAYLLILSQFFLACLEMPKKFEINYAHAPPLDLLPMLFSFIIKLAANPGVARDKYFYGGFINFFFYNLN